MAVGLACAMDPSACIFSRRLDGVVPEFQLSKWTFSQNWVTLEGKKDTDPLKKKTRHVLPFSNRFFQQMSGHNECLPMVAAVFPLNPEIDAAK